MQLLERERSGRGIGGAAEQHRLGMLHGEQLAMQQRQHALRFGGLFLRSELA